MGGAQQQRHLQVHSAGVLLAWVLGVLSFPSLPAAPPHNPESQKEPTLFEGWPESKPAAVLILSGQMYGYLQPCGCSRPQLGGLERRANLIAHLRAKGWPLAGVDLGDLPPVAGVVREQQLWKYAIAMESLREMGYVAIGAGKAEFAQGLYALLDQYAGVKARPPYLLAGNVLGRLGPQPTPRTEAFLGPDGRPMVKVAEVAVVGSIPIGLAGVVGASVQKEVEKSSVQTLVAFAPEKEALAEAVSVLNTHQPPPAFNVLIYQGSEEEARTIAQQWPQFAVIVCRSGDTLPPEQPHLVRHATGAVTRIIHTGWKGQYVGVLAAFPRTPSSNMTNGNPAEAKAGWDFYYQRVPLTERWNTPGSEEAARRANPILRLLDTYAQEVQRRNYLARFPEHVHPVTAKDPKQQAAFVGSEACARCHAAEYEVWKQSRHSHAYETLERYAKRPAGRQYDGECAVCHTVGLGYKTGFRGETSTPHLKHVGCESCHGPGSAHVADPKNPLYLALQSPWREDPADRLPEIAVIQRLAALPPAQRAQVPLTAAQQRGLNAVTALCMNCHDADNDPHFDLPVYWPKVFHASKR
ncbi:MAG: hypothetical protein NZU63_07155 [Gemmataceae bacterium]|nr:hypothetical protein [Gemmataceae bacterium]MDW8243471.1 multiheme c-type cytochrome [Thermogemmata sp.]